MKDVLGRHTGHYSNDWKLGTGSVLQCRIRDIMLNYKIVTLPSTLIVEKPVEITAIGAAKATKISVFIGLHSIRSVPPLLKTGPKTAQNP
jgi:hypothetical protein